MTTLEFEEITLHLESKECLVKGYPVKLSRKEFLVLAQFMLRPNKVFTRSELLTAIGTKFVGDHYVYSIVSRLKKKLGDAGRYIITRFGWGYVFTKHIEKYEQAKEETR